MASCVETLGPAAKPSELLELCRNARQHIGETSRRTEMCTTTDGRTPFEELPLDQLYSRWPWKLVCQEVRVEDDYASQRRPYINYQSIMCTSSLIKERCMDASKTNRLAVREYLANGQPLTELESVVLFGVTSLTDLVSSLRKEGWVFNSQRIPYAKAMRRVNEFAVLKPSCRIAYSRTSTNGVVGSHSETTVHTKAEEDSGVGSRGILQKMWRKTPRGLSCRSHHPIRKRR